MAVLSLLKEGYHRAIAAIAEYATATFWLILTLVALLVLR